MKLIKDKYFKPTASEIHLCRSSDHFRTGISVLDLLRPVIWDRFGFELPVEYRMIPISDFLSTRGLSVYETWGSFNIPGRIDFYIGSVSLEQIPTKVKKSGMSIIILSNVNDTVYPPQKKSFYMIRIIHERPLENKSLEPQGSTEVICGHLKSVRVEKRLGRTFKTDDQEDKSKDHNRLSKPSYENIF